ncbi:MAG: carbohydrate kinase [Planctomycetes bacterium]|nr:carbohydrate kinase [Planctomycetota bacterium]
MYLIGYDAGSSSIKATLLDAESGEVVASGTAPKEEMEIIAPYPGWAQQEPELWWQHLKTATAEMMSQAKIDPADIKAIGISYQMHGLVLVDKDKKPLRQAIIWCDSRAVEIGNEAAQKIGHDKCFQRLLNFPGNFTASKLRWVRENEPQIYSRIYKVMLPGDYIAMKMTGEIVTTVPGLSEAILWDFQQRKIADIVLDCYDIDSELFAPAVETFSVQGELTASAAAELGLRAGIKIAYRAGDQPNNAFSLNVLDPGQIAATAGTSGVVCGIAEEPNYDAKSRVNTFVHVNNTMEKPRLAVLLCLNGAGILNSWLKHNIAGTVDYDTMNKLAAKTPIDCDGLVVLPYGNGAERPLANRDIGASVHGLRFNTHNGAHLLRAGQQGIVFALNYGLEIMKDMGVKISTVRAGGANMFLSPLFCEAFANVTDSVVQLYNTDGSQGAARGAGIGAGLYRDFAQAFDGLKSIRTIEPDPKVRSEYLGAYEKWLDILNRQLC